MTETKHSESTEDRGVLTTAGKNLCVVWTKTLESMSATMRAYSRKALVERFAALFHGNEADAWGSYRYTGKVDVNGKKEKQSLTHQPGAAAKSGLNRELVLGDWEGHLTGSKDRIGVCPIIDRTQNKVLWGAIDVDSQADPKV